MKAGRLSVYEEDGEIVARTICDNEQGFILMNNRHAEMRRVLFSTKAMFTVVPLNSFTKWWMEKMY